MSAIPAKLSPEGFDEKPVSRSRQLLCLITLALAGLSASVTQALPSSLAITQYKHTRWTIDDGAPSSILALAQGKNGFLWIGAAGGLFRFDGISFQAISPERQIGDRSAVTAILAAKDGSIWIGYSAGGIARYESGVLRDADVPHPTENVQQLVQTHDGAVWGLLGRSASPLVRFKGGRWLEIGGEWGLPPVQGSDLLVGCDGTLWLSTGTPNALFFLRPGSHRFERASFVPTGNAALAQDRHGTVWISDQVSVRSVSGGSGARYPYPVPFGARGRRALFDRDGSLWGNAFGAGLYRIRSPKAIGERSAAAAAAHVERLREGAFLTSDQVSAVLEDREGNIWVGTIAGLDRFRATPVITEPLLTKVPSWGSVLLPSPNGEVFVGQHDGIYSVHSGGRVKRIAADLGEAEAMCSAPDGTAWAVMGRAIISLGGTRKVLSKPETRQAIIDCAFARDGSMLLTAGSGLYQLSNGHWRLYPIEQDDSTGGAMPIIVRRDGKAVVYATSSSLRVYDLPHHVDILVIRPFALRHLRTIYEMPDSIILAGRFGLARWHGSKIDYLTRSRVPALTGTSGILSFPGGDTWLMCKAGIVRISTADLARAFDKRDWAPPTTIYNFRDGLAAGSHEYGKHDVVRGGDGRLWFATNAGVVWINPADLSRNPLPPPVVISALSIDRKTFRDPQDVVVSPGAKSIVIDFNALTLGVPERVKVRYRLEGADETWSDAGLLRRASYSGLPPGHYRFNVIAANQDGVWNRTGASLSLTVQPTFLQSKFFLLLCGAAGCLVLWAAYSVRTRQLTARVRERLEAQLSERERIARELHDTLLQGFQGLVLRFQSVANRMARNDALRPAIDEALDEAETVLTEGRNRVSDLRFANDDADLAGTIAALSGRLGAFAAVPVRVTVEGHVRPLDAMVREEIMRIAEEAIRNAVSHAGATQIEVALVYGRQFQLGVRDDGGGLPAEVAAAGRRAGHFGLVGMRERAERAGGKLSLASGPSKGTEVRVSVPGRLAYAGAPGPFGHEHGSGTRSP